MNTEFWIIVSVLLLVDFIKGIVIGIKELKMKNFPDNLAIGDEEFISELDRQEERAENARRSHKDGSHVNKQLTYEQRLNIGCMMREMAGDV